MNKSRESGSARETVLKILYRVIWDGAYANIELNKVLGEGNLSGPDRGLATELVYGTLRMQGSIDYILDKFLKKPLSTLTPWIQIILRLGVYQMFYMEKIPDRAAVNEAVNLTKKYGHPGTVKLVNGVLRNIARNRETIVFPLLEKDPVAHISAVYSHPAWLVRRWIGQMGVEETIWLCTADNLPAPVTARTNTLKISRPELLERLAGEGVQAKPGSYAPESIVLEAAPAIGLLSSFREGLFQIQDESSALAAHILGAKPGSRVIDACAAPGGKTTHLAQLMENRGMIKAFDIHQHKLGLIKDNCRRLGIDIVDACSGDSRSLPDSLSQWADYVLVDAPCSGLGVLRRRPDARWNKDDKQIHELVQLQKEILLSAAQTVRPGGLLLYSVCTITLEESTEMAAWFMKNRADFRLEPFTGRLPFKPSEKDQAQAAQGMMQMLPHLHGTDGFFTALFRRTERGN